MKILVIEDDAEMLDYLVKGLAEAGHAPERAVDGEEAMQIAARERFDVLIVDRMLPGVDGLTVIERLRTSGDDTPTLVLSALGEVDDRVEGLRRGGDDYLVKPFAFPELVARLEALVRRSSGEAVPTTLRVGDLKLDRLNRKVHREGREIDLQPKEFQILECLMRHSGQVVTRTMLLEQVWNYNFDPQTNVIDVHVSRLRSKLDRDFPQPMIHTVRGAGYVLRAVADR